MRKTTSARQQPGLEGSGARFRAKCSTHTDPAVGRPRPFPSRPPLLTLTNTTTARRSRNSAPNDTRLPDASSTGSSATAAARGCPGSVSEPVGVRTGPAQPLTCRVTGAAIAGVGRLLGSSRGRGRRGPAGWGGAQRDGAGLRLGSRSTPEDAAGSRE